MPDYRLYHLDGAGCVKAVEWLDAAGDDCAIAAAGSREAFAQCEIWQGRRLVTRLTRGAAMPQALTSPGAPWALPEPDWSRAGPLPA